MEIGIGHAVEKVLHSFVHQLSVADKKQGHECSYGQRDGQPQNQEPSINDPCSPATIRSRNSRTGQVLGRCHDRFIYSFDVCSIATLSMIPCLGIPTQCVREGKIPNANSQYCNNVALKLVVICIFIEMILNVRDSD